jgi:hypothetical protein
VKTKYKDRPANEGKHGDAAEEPNSGVPEIEPDPPRQPESGQSGKQTRKSLATPSGSESGNLRRR